MLHLLQKSSSTPHQPQTNVQSEPKMAHSHQPIPMPYSSLTPEKPKEGEEQVEEKPKTKKKHKKKMHEIKPPDKVNKEKHQQTSSDMPNEDETILDQFPVYFW